MKHFADYVRFEEGVQRAVRGVAEVLIERLVDPRAVELGAADGFREAANYLTRRTWKRNLDVPTTGIVAKGGAVTGVYSAGVVWVLLNLTQKCMADPDCSGSRGEQLGTDHRFRLISGTSTGAMISTAIDYFNSGTTHKDREGRIDRLARWFTCLAVKDLYCLRSESVFKLIHDQKGIVEFDGIETQLRRAVDCNLLGNGSELIVNAVDFRSGRLLALSDQDPAQVQRPCHMIDAIVASAVLPVIAKPVDYLPTNYKGPDGGPVRATYLDGGVRSELPILPLARRGAERLVVISSSASVIQETGALDSAAGILQRYTDIATGAIMETEIDHAQRLVESVRLAELEACESTLDSLAKSDRPVELCQGACVKQALCEGRYDDVCSGSPAPASADGGVAPASEPKEPDTSRAADRIVELWQTKSFHRDEEAVTAGSGYDFDPARQRSLFRAGADAARVRCLELARFLGMPVTKPGLRKKLVAWCSASLERQKKLCEDEPTHHDDDEDFRKCESPVTFDDTPDYSKMCRLPLPPQQDEVACGQAAPEAG